MMLVPDQEARAVYEASVAASLAPGKTLLFAHGFNVHFKEIVPPTTVDVAMIAPKSARPPGAQRNTRRGVAVPGLVAVHQDATSQALANALAYAAGHRLHPARGVLETTFPRGRRRPICLENKRSCVVESTALVQAGFETLTAAGYAPEIAYFECLQRAETHRGPDVPRAA